MFAGTHICLPLCLAGLSDSLRFNKGLPPRFSKRQLYVVALGGILPDLISLHISLEARQHSPSHTLWFAMGLMPLVMFFALPRLRNSFHVALAAWIGVVFHLLADMISGGIPFWGVGNGIVGKYVVPPQFWLPLDIFMILFTWYIFFRLRFLESKGTLRSPTCSWEEKILENWRQKPK